MTASAAKGVKKSDYSQRPKLKSTTPYSRLKSKSTFTTNEIITSTILRMNEVSKAHEKSTLTVL